MRCALLTGSSGFIGFHLCRLLLDQGFRVVGIDNLSDYYDVSLKQRRQAILETCENFTIINDSIEKPGLLMEIFDRERPEVVVHLAAQAGVRYSIENPRTYFESNIIGTFELLEAARAHPPHHMLLASTSSAYGANEEMPYVETCKADHQMSFYAATKKATEVMAHSYAHIYDLPITMFRFFTVYGPWGRPDMALFNFTKAILNDQAIDIYNGGEMWRDFTYIADLVKAITLLIDAIPVRSDAKPAQSDSLSPVAPWRIVNIGNSCRINLNDFIEYLERDLGVIAKKNYMPMQTGDVASTWADTTILQHLTGYRPETDVGTGIKNFTAWYKDYYRSYSQDTFAREPPQAQGA